MNNHDLLSRWLEETPENRQAFQEESLILAATETILKAMEMRGVTKAALAEQLGSSKAHVSQLLNGSRNMTLRTFARIAFSLDMAPSLDLKDLALLDGYVEQPEQDRMLSTYSRGCKIVENRPRKLGTPAALVQRASAVWMSHTQYEEAA